MRRERLLPLIVATALFIENMDSTAITTSLPMIAADLGVEPVALRLALTTYMLALAIGVTIGQPMDAAINFGFAFLTVGLISASSVWMMTRLARDAGAEMAGRAQGGREISEPRPAQRPGT
ncbi:hypothetical protein [Lysobacter sp. A289]